MDNKLRRGIYSSVVLLLAVLVLAGAVYTKISRNNGELSQNGAKEEFARKDKNNFELPKVKTAADTSTATNHYKPQTETSLSDDSKNDDGVKSESTVVDNNETSGQVTGIGFKKIKLLSPTNSRIYFGAFPDFGGPEDEVSTKRVFDFERLAKKNIAWAYFSQNWFNGIVYPQKAIHAIEAAGTIPFVRLMPRSSEEQFKSEPKFNLQNIIDGRFDVQLREWAREAKEDFVATGIPLLVDFAVEPNGNWFSWSGTLNGGGITTAYGDPTYPDGPERWRDAYRHIINLFREENVNHITWFFHPDIYANPDEEWNQAKYYYPGDDYIDWVGISIYGPQNPEENYWETFSEILQSRHRTVSDITSNKPLAVLEFGVTDNHPLGNKAAWLNDAFNTILNNRLLNFSAISYWHENWEEADNVFAALRIDSSPEALAAFRNNVKDKRFVPTLRFSNGFTLKHPVSEELPEMEVAEDSQTKTVPQIKPGISWQWQLDGDEVNTEYKVDLYDIDLENTPPKTIALLHKKRAKVICYFNAGAYEPYRSDSVQFPKEVIGNIMEGWEDERWLDISHYEKFASIMEKRLDMAVEKGCDGVEPDNIHAYQENSGFSLTYDDQLRYNKWLAQEAHRRGLAIALKNDGEQVKDLVNDFDFAVVEECFQYNECMPFTKFIEQNKAVLEVEYELPKSAFCPKAKELNFSALKMNMDLAGDRDACE